MGNPELTLAELLKLPTTTVDDLKDFKTSTLETQCHLLNIGIAETLQGPKRRVYLITQLVRKVSRLDFALHLCPRISPRSPHKDLSAIPMTKQRV